MDTIAVQWYYVKPVHGLPFFRMRDNPMLNLRLSVLFAVLILVVVAPVRGADEGSDKQLSPQELFDQRILPIFRSPNPSSCVQCHLAGVDLKNYILPSQEKTFVSLRDQGLIDLDNPEKSKVLTLIRMGDKDLDKGARLIHEKTRRAEYRAFAAWIKASSQDPKLRALPKLPTDERAAPERPDAVIRHARKSRVVDSFARNVWSQRFRCFPCHTPHEINPRNPRHKAPMKTLAKLRGLYPPEVLARLDIFKETPEATLQYLIEQSRNPPKDRLPMIDLKNPKESLLLQKPMSKLPKKRDDGSFEDLSFVLPVSHGGGLKMHKDDQSYKSFIAWIQDYAKVVGNQYTSVEELPADNWYGSKIVLQVTDAPKAWPTGIPVQLLLHSWNEQDGSWNAEPIAFTQGTVAPRRMVSGALFLLAPRGAKAANSSDRDQVALPGGRFLIKAYVDHHGRLEKDPTLMLGKEDFYGQTEIKKSRWREGFRSATAVAGNTLKK